MQYAPTMTAMFAAQSAPCTMPRSMQHRPASTQITETLRQSAVVSFVVYALISLLSLTCPAMLHVKAIAGKTRLDRHRHWEDRESSAA
jgi:hypothetical protein